ncbi:MAG: 30S ribosomal protein S16 [Myxococcales bacterium]|nr:30S ribosomal protein S16 [Myxococcales bacterium]
MAVKLRLARHGAKKSPYYRIVAANADARRDGRFLDHVGVYDPTTRPETIRLRPDRIRYWLGVGAEPTNTVQNLLDLHLEKAESNIRQHNLDGSKGIWVQGPPNSPAAQGVKGGPAYKPYKPKATTQYAAPAAAPTIRSTVAPSGDATVAATNSMEDNPSE